LEEEEQKETLDSGEEESNSEGEYNVEND